MDGYIRLREGTTVESVNVIALKHARLETKNGSQKCPQLHDFGTTSKFMRRRSVFVRFLNDEQHSNYMDDAIIV